MTTTHEQIRKAAVVVAALEAEAADALLERLSPEQASLVRRALVELDDIEASEQQSVFAEFVGRSATEAERPDDSGTPVETLISKAAPFQFLHDADGAELSRLLAGERPQTIAVVLSHLPSNLAAEALAALASNLQTDVMRRLAKLDETDPAVLADLEGELQRKFQRYFRGDRGRVAGLGAVHDILSEAAPSLRRDLLSNIARHDPQFAARLAPSTIAYDDLPRLSDASLRALCDEVDHEALVVALAGGELEFTRQIAGALPRLRAVQLQNAIDTLGPTPLSDVALAQEELLRAARALETSGRLEWKQSATAAT